MIATPRLVMKIKTGDNSSFGSNQPRWNNSFQTTKRFKWKSLEKPAKLAKRGKEMREPRYFIRPMPRIGNLQAPWLSQPGCCSPRNELTLNAKCIIA
jgi:hypothetical protein